MMHDILYLWEEEISIFAIFSIVKRRIAPFRHLIGYLFNI